jgi:hypothetical protein
MADKLTFFQGVGVAGPWNPAFGGGFGLERGAPPQWNPGLGGAGDPELYGHPVAEIVENSLNVLARCLSTIFDKSP